MGGKEGGREGGAGWGGSGGDGLSLGKELVYSFEEGGKEGEGHSEKKHDDVMMFFF